jgi:hypothetical protein
MSNKLIMIGKGKESEVFLNEIFVIKKYLNPRGVHYSFLSWDFLKSNSFNTFKTYEKIDENSIRMENLSLNNNFCVSTIGSNICKDNLDATYLKNNQISEILNFEKFITSGFNDVNKFLKLNFDLGYTDIFFFLGKKAKSTNLELFYGDLEKSNIGFGATKVPQIKKFYVATLDFLNYFVEKKNAAIYINVLNKKFNDVVESYESNGIKFSRFEK